MNPDQSILSTLAAYGILSTAVIALSLGLKLSKGAKECCEKMSKTTARCVRLATSKQRTLKS